MLPKSILAQRARHKALLDAYGIHQADAADRAGVPRPYVSHYFRGRVNLTLEEFTRLRDAIRELVVDAEARQKAAREAG